MGFIIADIDRRWPRAEVPYEVNGAQFPPGSAASDMIRDAINTWNETALVKFVPRNGHADFVMFQSGSACNSPVGRQGGQQAVTCAVAVGFGRGSVMHEMGHAMGLYHEQQRPDRNTFVTVSASAPANNYAIRNDGIPVSNYDCASIMHYPNVAGNIFNNGPGCSQMGQRISPSRTDLEALRLGYPIHEMVTLGDASDVREALAEHSRNLFLAWRGLDTNLNISVSTDGGISFGGKHTSSESSSHAPAIASHNGRLFIAWKGDGNENLNVAKVDLVANTAGDLAVEAIVEKVTLGDTSDSAPALASHAGRLFLAWRGSGNDDLNLAFSDDDGASFGGKMTFAESSDDAPALASHNGALYMAWRGSGNEDLNLAQVDLFASTAGGFGIEGLSNKVILSETSDFSPALASCEGVLYMAWRGSGNENLNIIATVDGTNFFEKRVSFESSSDAPALAAVERRVYYGWKGSNNDSLNVGEVTRVIRPVGHAQSGNLIHGTAGNKGNFELLLAQGGQIRHYFRANDTAGVPWSGTPAAPQAAGATPAAVCLIQPRGPNFDLAAIHWMQSPGLSVLTFAQNLNLGAWSVPTRIIADGNGIVGVTGKPSFLQGTFGGYGNFELVVPAGSRILHYWRDNDSAGNPWHGPDIVEDFNPTAAGVALAPVAVTMTQSSFGSPGNLELIARIRQSPVGIGTPRPDYLTFLWRDGSGWRGPVDVVADGERVEDVTGDPSMIWSTFGVRGNFELVVPIGGRKLMHYWRDNDRLDLPWHGPELIHGFASSGPLAGRPVAASLTQGRYTSPGNLELVVRVDPQVTPFTPAGPHLLVFFFRDGGGWHGPFPITVGAAAIANVTGF